MEKQLVKTLIVTFLFVMGYMFVMQKHFPKPPQQTEIVKEEKILKTPQASSQINIEKETEKLPETTIGKFIVTYSPRGGYIKNISLKDYQATLLPENIGFIQEAKETEYQPRIGKDKIVFTSAKGQTKEFSFEENVLKIKISPSPARPMVLFSNPLGAKNLQRKPQELFYYQKDSLKKVNPKKADEKILQDIQFAGTCDYHFCLSLIKGAYNIQMVKDENNIYVTMVPPVPEVSLYVGPQIEKNLKPLGLEGVVNYGLFHGVGIGLAKLLYFFHSITKNWGASIILLAIITYVILLPFTAKSTKAMKRMQAVQPEIEELKKKYKDNPQKLNKETLELYKKYKINPIGGCLPLLFQFPVFIALYQVLLKFVELRNANFLWIKDLSQPDHAIKLPFPAPLDYLNVLPLLIVVVGLIQQKVSGPMGGSSEQKSMGLIMTLFMGVIFYNFPSGLTLYWLTQNILTLAYHMRVSRASFHVKTA
ncbi:MAG: membrane protein insertase YidC [Candidatus Omnitrophica bacterium]|jgi:YidC/Oxa1 family membrane protein insertase|nr:membrane protein insertase YidC [Candidatus Omnitrophota bacterium]